MTTGLPEEPTYEQIVRMLDYGVWYWNSYGSWFPGIYALDSAGVTGHGSSQEAAAKQWYKNYKRRGGLRDVRPIATDS